jgi:hypothetical protein
VVGRCFGLVAVYQLSCHPDRMGRLT